LRKLFCVIGTGRMMKCPFALEGARSEPNSPMTPGLPRLSIKRLSGRTLS
jgi:hypothetical protein